LRLQTNPERHTAQEPPLPRLRPPQPPPRFAPDFCKNPELLTNGFLRNHLHHYVYIWLLSGHEFWMFPTQLDGNTYTGYIWDADGWKRYTFDTRLIRGLY